MDFKEKPGNCFKGCIHDKKFFIAVIDMMQANDSIFHPPKLTNYSASYMWQEIGYLIQMLYFYFRSFNVNNYFNKLAR